MRLRALATLAAPAALLTAAACGEAVTKASPPLRPCQPSLNSADRAHPKQGMVHIPAGTYTMGAGAIHGEEGPGAKVTLKGFWIDRTEVTNAAFARFVAATGYQTQAERPLDPLAYPQFTAAQRSPASLVFVGQDDTANRSNPLSWWKIVPGANWRHPQGPKSDIKGKDLWPVVHVSYADAQAYAQWVGHQLPTEAQWEYAARGGLDAKTYVWGDAPAKTSKPMANNWQGVFPMIDTGDDGYKAQTASVGCFRANGYGLLDMAGNVWEWTSDWYKPGLSKAPGQGPPQDLAYDPADPAVPKHVVKGGSYLCADDYCFRYRPAARSPGPADGGASHTGFRTIIADISPSPPSNSQQEKP